MGNAELKSAFQSAISGINSKGNLGLTTEILLENQQMTYIEDYIKQFMNVDSKSMQKAFTESNIQLNENADVLQNYLSGFATAESNIEALKLPSFERFFTVNCHDDSQDFTKKQQQRLFILCALCIDRQHDEKEKVKGNFFEFISKYLEKQKVDQRIKIGIESGFNFSLSLLKQIKSINKDMVIGSLEYLYQTLRGTERGSLFSTDQLSFLIDSNLNDARAFMVNLIEDKDSTSNVVELALKVILLLGYVRSNVEDFIIVANILDKINIQVDLRSELKLLTNENQQNSGLSVQVNDFNERKIKQKSTFFYMKAGSFSQKITLSSSLSTDGRFIYMHQQGLGLFKFEAGLEGKMMGQLQIHKKDYRSEEQVFLCYLNGKLYCRVESMKPNPFVIINPQTLEEEKEEFEIDKVDQNLEWKENKDSGRSLTHSPLFTDGEFLYVFVEQKEQLFVECYDPSTPQLKFVRQIELFKNTQKKPYKKSINIIKDSNIVTNGSILLIQKSIKENASFFDLKTGIRIQKVKLGPEHQNSKFCYDNQNNIFYQIQDSPQSYIISSFKITNFKKAVPFDRFSKQFLEKRLIEMRQIVQGEEDQSQIMEQNEDLSKFNIIQRIIRDVTSYDLIQSRKPTHSSIMKGDQQNTLQRTIILHYLNQNCSRFQTQIDDLKLSGQGQTELWGLHLMTFFKYQGATYLTQRLFQEIQKNLEKGQVLFNQRKTIANLPEQYSFYFILKILSANLEALRFCSISVTDIMDKLKSQDFLKQFKGVIIQILEEGQRNDFEEGEQESEMKQLWQEIYKTCVNIFQDSIEIFYSDSKEILTYLQESINEGPTNYYQQKKYSILINYLIKSVGEDKFKLNDKDELKMVMGLYQQVCLIMNQEIEKDINTQIQDMPNYLQISKTNLFKQSINDFIKFINEHLLLNLFSQTKYQLEKMQKEKQDGNTNKEEEILTFQNKLQALENIISIIFDINCQEIIHIINVLIHKLSQFLVEISEIQNEEINIEYAKISVYFEQLLQERSGIFSSVTLILQAFLIFKVDQKFSDQLTQKIVQIQSSIERFYVLSNKHSNKIKINQDNDKLTVFLNAFSRQICYFVGVQAQKLLIVTNPLNQIQKQEKDQHEIMQDLIIQSNILSGGIENRFITQFSEETQNQIKELVKISNDQKLELLLKEKHIDSIEDLTLQAIIHQGKDEKVDRLISYMQSILESKRPLVAFAKLGGTDGMRLSRAAFAVMIKFSEFFDDFQTLLFDLDLQYDMLRDLSDRDSQIKEYLKAFPNFDQVIKRWESASRMRQWIGEKKQNLMERIKKQIQDEFKSKRFGEIKKPEPVEAIVLPPPPPPPYKAELLQEPKELEDTMFGGLFFQEEEKQESSEDEQIDTTSKAIVEVVVEQIKLTAEENQAIDIQADQNFDLELQAIYVKIIEKAEFLIRLQVPVIYLVKDPYKKNEEILSFIRNPSNKIQESETQEIEEQFDWRERLKQWKHIQTTHKNQNKHVDRKKEIFDSSVMSVLACLQISISAERIKTQVESQFLNGIKRSAGLKLLSQISGLVLPQKIRLDIINWLCSSLRGNTNKFKHYLDDLKGCGKHLEDQVRENFFSIIKTIANQLADAKDDQEIKLIINSLQWKYTARDHSFLIVIDIFKVLRDGNRQGDSKIKALWGSTETKGQKIKSENDLKLYKEVIEVFEQIFILTLGRIIKPESGDSMKLKQRGTSVPNLEKAVSLVDENASEHLIAQAFDMIFKEFDSYVNTINKYNNVEQEGISEQQVKVEDIKLEIPLQQPEEVKIEGQSIAQQEVPKELTNEQIEQKLKEKQEILKKKVEANKQEMKQYQLQQQPILSRFLRLVEIFTSIANNQKNLLSMVLRVANPYQLKTLLNLLMVTSPKIKLIVIKVIQNLIRIAIPFEIFEETITLITLDQNSPAKNISDQFVASTQIQDSKFLKFLYNYLMSIRNNMWSSSEAENEGQYVVTEELIKLFRFLYLNSPQKELRSSIHRFIKIILTQEQWNLEEYDRILSIIPGGSFLRFQAGSKAIYKENQQVVILSFSDGIKNDKKFEELSIDQIRQFKSVSNLENPQTQVALVVFMIQQSKLLDSEIKAIDCSQLIPLPCDVEINDETSILYDVDVLKNLIKKLSIMVEKETDMNVTQGQLQIVKMILYQIEEENKTIGKSAFLEFLDKQNLLSELIIHMRRLSNTPWTLIEGQKNLPIEYLELYVSSLRTKALESSSFLISNEQEDIIVNEIHAIFEEEKINPNPQKSNEVIKKVDQNDQPDSNANLWEDVFAKMDITKLISKSIFEIPEKEETKDYDKSRKQYFAAAFQLDKISKAKNFQRFYSKVLNNLLIMQSRKGIMNFLINTDKLPIELIPDQNELDKIILISFNEGIIQYNATGDKTVLRNIKKIIKKITKEDKMNDYLLAFVNNKLLKPAILAIKKINENKDFLINGTLESEDEAQNFPSPQLIISVFKIILKLKKEVFLEQKGILSDAISVLIGFAFVQINRDPKKSIYINKLLDLVSRLLDLANQNVSHLKYGEDIVNNNFIIKLQGTVEKLKGIKKSESLRILNEIYVEHFKLQKLYIERKQYLPLTTPQKQNYLEFQSITYSQVIIFQKRLQFIVQKEKDPLLCAQINFSFKQRNNIFARLQASLDKATKSFKTHPQSIISPFITKIKAINSETINLIFKNTNTCKHSFSLNNNLGCDIKFFSDPEGKNEIQLKRQILNEAQSDKITTPIKFNYNLTFQQQAEFIQLPPNEQYKQLKREWYQEIEVPEQFNIWHHPHPLVRRTKANYQNWVCDGRKLHEAEIGGRQCFKDTQTNNGWICAQCKFDICYECSKISLYLGNIRSQKTEKVQIYGRKELYMGVSSNKLDELAVFGNNDGGKLGNGEIIQKQEIQGLNTDLIPAYIESCKNHTLLVDRNQKAYFVGNLRNEIKLDFEQVLENVKLISTSINSIMIVTKQNEIYFGGKIKEIYKDKENYNQQQLLFKDTDFAGHNIISIACGNNYALVVGEVSLFGIGKNLFTSLGLIYENKGFQKIILADNIQVKNVWCSKAKQSNFIFIESEENEEVKQENGEVSNKKIRVLRTISKILSDGQQEQIQSISFEKVKFEKQILIKKLSILTHHILLLTEEGELYGWGSNEYQRLGFDESIKIVEEPKLLNFFNNKERFIILDIAAGDDHSLIYVEEKDNNKNSSFKRLYQIVRNIQKIEQAKQEVQELEQIDQSVENIQYFENQNISLISAGHQTSFVYIPNKKQNNKNNYNSWIEQYQQNEVSKNVYVRHQIHFYYDLNHNNELNNSEIEAKQQTIDQLKNQLLIIQVQDFKDSQQIVSQLEQQQKYNSIKQQIKELRLQIALKKKENLDPTLQGWKIIDKEDLSKNKNQILTFAIKHQMPQFYNKILNLKKIYEEAIKFLEEENNENENQLVDHGVNCQETDKPITGIRYYAQYMINNELIEINLSEEAFNQPSQFDLVPTIYYRLARKIKEGVKLPVIDISQYFSQNQKLNFEYTIQSLGIFIDDAKLFLTLLEQIQAEIPSAQQYIKLFQMGKEKYNDALIKFQRNIFDENELAKINTLLAKENEIQLFIKDNNQKDSLTSEEVELIKQMTFLSEENVKKVKAQFTLLQDLGNTGLKQLKKISNRAPKGFSKKSVLYGKKYIFRSLPNFIKQTLVQQTISNLPIGSYITISIKRSKAWDFIEKGGCDHEGNKTIFGQIYQQMKVNAETLKCFWINKPDKKIFKVKFVGEGSIDRGGPYRDCITNICSEIQSSALPLMIPTPNNKNNHGLNRECFMINPSSLLPNHLDMFKYFGYYLGMAIRSEQALALDLAPVFWRNLLNEYEATSIKEKEADLKTFDTFQWQVLEDLRNQASTLSESEFEEAFDQYFITLRSDGSQIELISLGSKIKVTKTNLNQYIELVIEARISESQKQMKAIQEGVNFVIPLEVCKYLNWKAIERRATGSKTLNIEDLKKITNYGDDYTEDHETIQIFWQTLESFTQEERSLYLKFVWGRARLPAKTGKNHNVTALEYEEKSCLPISHTCFFTIDLPRYPTYEICRERLLYAIVNCAHIDGDGTINESDRGEDNRVDNGRGLFEDY